MEREFKTNSLLEHITTKCIEIESTKFLHCLQRYKLRVDPALNKHKEEAPEISDEGAVQTEEKSVN